MLLKKFKWILLIVVLISSLYADDIDDLVGVYRSLPVKNGWSSGRVSIHQVNSLRQLKWTNDAGRSWALHISPEYGVLLTDETCPYYKSSEGKHFRFIREGGRIVGFMFNRSFYTRDGVSTPTQIIGGGAHGYIGMGIEAPQQEYMYGFSYYITVWPLLDKSIANFSAGLPSTWLIPDNRDFHQPLVDESTRAWSWKEREYNNFSDVFQTIEGGLGFWDTTKFPSTTPKFRMNGTPDGYNTMISSPGWTFKGQALKKDELGIAQLSNRIIVPPDGITLAENSTGTVFGNAWMALTLSDAKSGTAKTSDGNNPDVSVGDHSWTLFLNTTNFKGPVAFFIPDTWTRLSKRYNTIIGRGLDERPAYTKSASMEIGYVPHFKSVDASGKTYTKIPKLQFPVDENGRSILVRDVSYYSSNAVRSDGVFDKLKTIYPNIWANPFRLTQKDNGININLTGFDIRTEIYNQNGQKSFALKWGDAEAGLKGLPEYYRQNGNIREGINVEQVPEETGLKSKEFLNPILSHTLVPDITEEWTNPGPSSKNYTTVLKDGSIVTYTWYRFIDQPSIRAMGWSNAELNAIQKKVETIHKEWSGNQSYMQDPKTGKLSSLDGAVLVTPPQGMEIGYVPIVIEQRTHLHKLNVSKGSNSGSYAQGSQIRVVANSPSGGLKFDRWVGDVSIIENVNDSTTVALIPASEKSIQATYINQNSNRLRIAPNVLSKSQELARGIIKNSGLQVGTVSQINHQSVPAGSIVSQSPESGVKLNPNGKVNLVISSGPKPIELRDPDNPSKVKQGIHWERFLGDWDKLPNFDLLTVQDKGVTHQFKLGLGEPDDHFAYQYTGYIHAPKDGEYTFYSNSDDGSKVYIGHKEIVNYDGLHGMRNEQNGKIGLKAGYHSITVRLFEKKFGQGLLVSWQGPGFAKEEIPASVLYHEEIIPINQAPVITRSLEVAPEHVVENENILFLYAASDPDIGDSLSYKLSKLSGPGNLKLGKGPFFVPYYIDLAGNYVIRLTVSDGKTSVHSDLSLVVHPAEKPPETYKLNVAHGLGSGDYETGKVVQLLANPPPEGYVFDKWLGDISSISNVNKSNTTLVMPAQTLNITASFKINNPGVLIGELGKLNLKANGGINPATGKIWQEGDVYRLAFVTSQPISATANKLSSYDHFIQNLANAQGLGKQWKVIGSSSTVDAKTHTASDPNKNSANVSIFLIDGNSLLAKNYSHFWDGNLNVNLNKDETGATVSSIHAWTGTNIRGEKESRSLGGSTTDNPSRTSTGHIFKSSRWLVVGHDVSSALKPVYALSDPLFIKLDKGVVNQTPQINEAPKASPSIITLPSSTSLTIRASDADGDELIYTWNKQNGPGKVHFSSNGTSQSNKLNATFSEAGQYVLKVTITDGISTTADQFATVNVTVHDPIRYNLTVNQGIGSGSYIEGQVVKLQASAAPSGQVFSKWIGSVSTISNINLANTTITMPASSIMVSASYIEIDPPIDQGNITKFGGSDGASDSWNVAYNWSEGIPIGNKNVLISSGLEVKVDNENTPSYFGELTIEPQAAMRLQSRYAGSQNALTHASSLTMHKNSTLFNNLNTNITFPPILLKGAVTIDAPFGRSDWQTSELSKISGSHSLLLKGFNGHRFHFNESNTFSELISIPHDRHYIVAKAKGALGLGNVTINGRSDGRSAQLIIEAQDSIADGATLTLNGKGFDNNSDERISISAGINEVVARLIIAGEEMPAGTYDKREAWLSGEGRLTVTNSSNSTPVLSESAPPMTRSISEESGSLILDHIVANYDGASLTSQLVAFTMSVEGDETKNFSSGSLEQGTYVIVSDIKSKNQIIELNDSSFTLQGTKLGGIIVVAAMPLSQEPNVPEGAVGKIMSFDSAIQGGTFSIPHNQLGQFGSYKLYRQSEEDGIFVDTGKNVSVNSNYVSFSIDSFSVYVLVKEDLKEISENMTSEQFSEANEISNRDSIAGGGGGGCLLKRK